MKLPEGWEYAQTERCKSCGAKAPPYQELRLVPFYRLAPDFDPFGDLVRMRRVICAEALCEQCLRWSDGPFEYDRKALRALEFRKAVVQRPEIPTAVLEVLSRVMFA